MDTRDRSIVVQVVAKIAAELTPHALDSQTTDHTPEEIGNVFNRILGVVLDGVVDGLSEMDAKMGVAQPQPQPQAKQSPIDRIKDAFPGSTEGNYSHSVRVAGRQHGDLPAWLRSAAAEKGTTAVFDNRDKVLDAQGRPLSKRPWFVDADNRDNAFWPPKKAA